MSNYHAHRVLILAWHHWDDPDYLEQEFLRLESIHRKVRIIYPDDTARWQLYVHDLCKQKPKVFVAMPFPKDVFTCGSGPDLNRDYRMFYDGKPDEVWKIESSPNYPTRPEDPIYPEIWAEIKNSNIPSVVHRNPYRKPKPYNPNYIVPAKTYRNQPKSLAQEA